MAIGKVVGKSATKQIIELEKCRNWIHSDRSTQKIARGELRTAMIFLFTLGFSGVCVS